jgi:hypothetical protein
VGQYFGLGPFAVTPNNQSPFGLALRLFTINPYTVPIAELPQLVPAIRWAVAGLALLLLARTISRSRGVKLHRLALEYGLAIVGMLFVSPLSEDIHYVYLLIPMAAIAASVVWGPAGSRERLGIAAALAACYTYLSLPGLNGAMFAFYEYHQGPVPLPKALLTGLHLYGLCGLAVLTFVTIRWHSRVAIREDGRDSAAHSN